MKRARPGETVTFECLPYGKPFPTIKWLKDGIELLPGDGITIEALPDGTQKLTVENVDFLREGYYRCVATNEHGTASTKAELTVTGKKCPVRVVKRRLGVILKNYFSEKLKSLKGFYSTTKSWDIYF